MDGNLHVLWMDAIGYHTWVCGKARRWQKHKAHGVTIQDGKGACADVTRTSPLIFRELFIRDQTKLVLAAAERAKRRKYLNYDIDLRLPNKHEIAVELTGGVR